MKKVIVLGCGYLGYNIAAYLIKKGHIVQVLGLNSFYVPSIEEYFHEMDVFDINVLRNFDFNDAIVVDTMSLIKSNAEYLDQDIVLKELERKYQMLLLYLKDCSIQNYIFFSSGGTVYGEVVHPVNEDYPLHPLSFYAKSKVMIEEIILKSEIPYLILRLSNPYGGLQEKEKTQGVIPILINDIIHDKTFYLRVSPNSTRDYLYIDDLLAYLKLLLDKNVCNEVFNIGSGSGISIGELISIIEKAMEHKLRIVVEKSSLHDVEYVVLDTTKLRQVTNYIPAIDLDVGIQKEIARLKE